MRSGKINKRKTAVYYNGSLAFFPPIRRKVATKTQGRSPDLQRPCTPRKIHFVAYRPPSSHFFAVKRNGRSYGCGGSGATLLNNKFLSSLLNSFRRKSTARSYAVLSIFWRKITPRNTLNRARPSIPFSSWWKSNSRTPTQALRASRLRDP